MILFDSLMCAEIARQWYLSTEWIDTEDGRPDFSDDPIAAFCSVESGRHTVYTYRLYAIYETFVQHTLYTYRLYVICSTLMQHTVDDPIAAFCRVLPYAILYATPPEFVGRCDKGVNPFTPPNIESARGTYATKQTESIHISTEGRLKCIYGEPLRQCQPHSGH